MRRMSWLLVAGLSAMPVVAAANPDTTPSEQYTWSFSSGRGRLGVTVISLTPDLRHYFGTADDRGLLVAHVEPGSPAAAANIRAGDVITAVKGQPVNSAGDVLSSLEKSGKGADISVDLVRDRKTVTVHAVLADEPSPAQDAQDMPKNLRGKPRIPPEIERMMREMMRDWPAQGMWRPHHDRMI